MLAFICIFFCIAFAAYGQQQDPDIAKRLQTRNVDVAPLLFQNKAFLTDYSFNGTHGANVNTFYFIDHVRTKDFATRSLYGVKNYWSGDFKYDTNAANLNNRNIVVKPFETQTVAIKAANESGKDAATHTYVTGDYKGRGKSQDRFDKEGPDAFKGPVPVGLGGDMHPMTMEEVRNLLNKNK